MQINAPPLLCGIHEATKLLGLGRSKVYELIGENKLETVRIGGRRLVRWESIERLAREGCDNA